MIYTPYFFELNKNFKYEIIEEKLGMEKSEKRKNTKKD